MHLSPGEVAWFDDWQMPGGEAFRPPLRRFLAASENPPGQENEIGHHCGRLRVANFGQRRLPPEASGNIAVVWHDSKS